MYVCPILDLSSARSMSEFWSEMQSRNLVWMLDYEGQKLTSFDQIPESINDMSANDPYAAFPVIAASSPCGVVLP